MDIRLQQNPLWLSLLLASHLRYHVAEFAEQHDFTPSQLQSLLLLEPQTPIPISRLSCMAGCDPSFATGIVDHLVQAQLVERRESTQDRRVKMITLSTKGAAVRKKLITDFYACYQSLSIADIASDDFIQDFSHYTQAILASNK